MKNASIETGHIGLNVSDLKRSTEFYQELLGFESLGGSFEDGKKFVFLGRGQKIVLTLWEQSNTPFNKLASGLHHLSFQVNSIQDVQSAQETLKRLGAKLFYGGIVSHQEGAQSGGIFFEDPDGIRLEIYAPTGAAEFESANQAPACGFF